MDRHQLELLYHKLIVQETYPGDTCPTEWKLVESAVGALLPQECSRLEVHLQMCQDCQKTRRQVGAASAWFSDHEAQILMGLVDKAIVNAVPPWDSCLSEDLLECYVQQDIPDTPAGERLRRSIELHLSDCSTCSTTVERLRAYLAKPWLFRLAGLVQQVDDEVRTALREAVDGLRLAASVRGVAAVAHAMPGFRSQPAPGLQAILLDSNGKMILGNDGLPQFGAFCLIRAQIDQDGTVIVELSAVDPQVPETREGGCLLGLTIHHEHRRLVFPSERIARDGHVTFVGHLVPGAQVQALPVHAIHLALHKTAADQPPV